MGAIAALPAALWWLFRAVPVNDPVAYAGQMGGVVSAVARALAGCAVLVWADRIVALFESGTTPQQIPGSTEMLAVGFALVGVFVMVAGFQEAAGAAHFFFFKPPGALRYGAGGIPMDTWTFMWERKGEAMVKAVVQIASGVFLVVGRAALVRGWSRLRGQSPSDAPDDDDA